MKKYIRVLLFIFAVFAVAGIITAYSYVKRVSDVELDLSLFRLDRASSYTRIFVMKEGEWTEWEQERILGEKSFERVAISEIPSNLKNAFIAIEDKRFYKHKGIDLYRTVAAAANYFLHFGGRFGASTITQQLIKNITGEDEVSPKRKLREISLSLKLEKELSKDEILELYLNVINLADGCYGVGSAAKRYFSKHVSELSLIECAAIAAITNNPSYYDPIRHPENNAERRDIILSQMLEQGMISQAEFDESYGAELHLYLDDSVVKERVHSWYIDMVIEDVITDLQLKRGMTRAAASAYVFGGGLDIYVQVDLEIQNIMEEYYQNTANFPSGDGAQSAMIIIDSLSGDVLGVVGAVGEKTGNRLQSYATDTLRPPGSTIKPLSVYAPALERGIISYASVYDDIPYTYTEGKNGSLTPWPKNANGVYHGLSTMSYAMANSTNTVPLKILDELGLSHSFYFLRDYLHLDALVESKRDSGGALITDMDYAALALGQLNYGVSVRDITAAYSIFADNGLYHAPRSYSEVKNSLGETVLKRESTSERVISDGNAEIMRKLLEDVVFGGTANALTVKKQVALAAKTGTTQDNKDRWCIGFTPSLICGVWYGYEYPKEIPRAEKDHFLNAMDTVLKRIYGSGARSSYADRKFESSANLVCVNYCMDSGLLPSIGCIKDARGSRVKQGYFVEGSEPTEACKTHVLVEYDAVCGGVATVFTPRGHVAIVGMISVDRELPLKILISDAQYVYHKLPDNLLPSFLEKEAFFAPLEEERKKYFGLSAGKKQFNRLSTAHMSYSDLVFERELLKNQN